MGENIAVIDHDDDFIKAGYANPEREPGVITPSLVRRAAAAGGDDDAAFLRPIVGRRVVDWDQLEAIYRDVFYRHMAWVEGDEGAALVTEPLFTSKADRERLTQIMFESFNVSGLYVAEQPVMALYGVGKVTGVAVHVGYSTVDVAPVVEGGVVIPAAQRCVIGSKHVSEVLGRMLGGEKQGVKGAAPRAAFTEAELDAIRDGVGAAAASREACAAAAGEGRGGGVATTHTLPDGNVITVDGAARLGCVEALFQPGRYGLGDVPGVSDALLAAVAACSSDQRRAVLDAVAVSGGWAGGAGREAGLDDRILRELEDAMTPSLKPMGAPVPEYMPETTARYAPWIGGSILAKVVFPQNQHISKIDYQENGPSFASKSRVS